MDESTNGAINRVYDVIDETHRDKSAATRRQMIGATSATLGGMGLLAMPGIAGAQDATVAATNSPDNTVENILNVAATAEVVATIVNTEGARRVKKLDKTTKENIDAAAREELIHYRVLTKKLGATPITERIWVPDKIFESEKNLLEALVIGDQIFINAYLIGVTAFGVSGSGKLARVAAEFMGVEAVHRALALQSLGFLGNDRAFVKFNQKDQGKVGKGQRGFTNILTAVKKLENAGFGFDERNRGEGKGQFYKMDKVMKDTPNPSQVNTRSIR